MLADQQSLSGHLIFSLVIRVDVLLPLAQKKCQAEQVTKLSMMLILESLQGMVLLRESDL